MKRPIKFIALLALFAVSLNCGAQQPPMGAGMDPVKITEYLKEMQAQMLTMHDLSNRILAETDPQKQQALKDQQLEMMKAQYLQMMSQRPN